MLRIHSSFHKCLTQYYMSIMTRLINNKLQSKTSRYEHFESIEGLVYNRVHKYKLVSSNGFAIDTNRLNSEYRITRFIRDPRDLIVSGYFYHLKGSEPWFLMKNPTERYWAAINGKVPDNMPVNVSYSSYLQGLSLEDGLLAEIEFRRYQLESLRNWKKEDPHIRLFKYENIVGNEEETFREIFDFMQFSAVEKFVGLKLAKRYSLSGPKARKGHIRNSKSGQWKEHFTGKVEQAFNDQFLDILQRYNYEI